MCIGSGIMKLNDLDQLDDYDWQRIDKHKYTKIGFKINNKIKQFV